MGADDIVLMHDFNRGFNTAMSGLNAQISWLTDFTILQDRLDSAYGVFWGEFPEFQMHGRRAYQVIDNKIRDGVYDAPFSYQINVKARDMFSDIENLFSKEFPISDSQSKWISDFRVLQDRTNSIFETYWKDIPEFQIHGRNAAGIINRKISAGEYDAPLSYEINQKAREMFPELKNLFTN